MLIWLVLFDLNRNGFGGVSNLRAWESVVFLGNTWDTHAPFQHIPPPAPTKGTKSSNNFLFPDILSTKPSCMHVFRRISFRWVVKLHFLTCNFALRADVEPPEMPRSRYEWRAHHSIKFLRVRCCFRLEKALSVQRWTKASKFIAKESVWRSWRQKSLS